MKKITLPDDTLTGITKVDEQHKELVDRVNALVVMGGRVFTRNEMEKTLDWLGEYVVQHFRDEEQLQIECNFPNHKSHKEKHEDFVEVFKKFKREFYIRGISQEFTTKLTQTVIDWVVEHINDADAELGKYYREYKNNDKQKFTIIQMV